MIKHFNDGFCEYALIDDESAALVKCNCQLSAFEIPKYAFSCNGENIYRITQIYGGAFSNSSVKHVTFDRWSFINELSDNTFIYSQVEDCLLPPSINKIGKRSFIVRNESTAEIKLEPGNKTFIMCHEIGLCRLFPFEVVQGKSKYKRINLRETIKVIGAYAFSRSRLKSIKFPATLRVIEVYAFYSCESLNSIIFPQDSLLQRIERYAFYHTRLVQIEFPSSLEVIEENAFQDIESLSRIFFQDDSKLHSIGVISFSSCNNLIAVSYPDSIKEYLLPCLGLNAIINKE